MRLEVVDPDERHVPRQRQRLGRRHADQQRADQARSDRAGDGVDPRLVDPGLDDRPGDDGVQARRGAPGWRSRARRRRSRRAVRSGWRRRSKATSEPPITNAAAVSSQLVSMPSTTRRVVGCHIASHVRRHSVTIRQHPRSRRPYAVGLDVVTPHDDRVLGVLVVPLADAGRREPEPAVQLLGAGARDPDLKRQGGAATVDRLGDERREQAGRDSAAPVVGGDRDVGDVAPGRRLDR